MQAVFLEVQLTLKCSYICHVYLLLQTRLLISHAAFWAVLWSVMNTASMPPMYFPNFFNAHPYKARTRLGRRLKTRQRKPAAHNTTQIHIYTPKAFTNSHTGLLFVVMQPDSRSPSDLVSSDRVAGQG